LKGGSIVAAHLTMNRRKSRAVYWTC